MVLTLGLPCFSLQRLTLSIREGLYYLSATTTYWRERGASHCCRHWFSGVSSWSALHLSQNEGNPGHSHGVQIRRLDVNSAMECYNAGLINERETTAIPEFLFSMVTVEDMFGNAVSLTTAANDRTNSMTL
ncbi:hypothetical protein DL96DRAFT_1564622 [Flagelloscypha sp. PMI_526]|nr:hypothetical protein DL96DRAFT_1564622 [Flagelloscypha sp. PMI_526]